MKREWDDDLVMYYRGLDELKNPMREMIKAGEYSQDLILELKNTLVVKKNKKGEEFLDYDLWMNDKPTFLPYHRVQKIIKGILSNPATVKKFVYNFEEADLDFEKFELICPMGSMSDDGNLTLFERTVLSHKDYPEDKKAIWANITNGKYEEILPQSVKDIFLF